MGGKGGGSVAYTPPAPSPQEQELLDLLLEEGKRRGALATERDAAIRDFMKTDFTKDTISPEQLAELDRISGIYQGTRTSAVDKAIAEGDKALRARFAAQGISDSSIAAGGYGELQAERSRQLEQIGKEAELYRYGTEKDIRNATLQERLQKIGILQAESNPSVTAGALSALSGQREAEASRALQIALANAQQGGGFNLLETLGGAGGSALGSLIAGPFGTGLGYSAGSSLGRSIGGGRF